MKKTLIAAFVALALVTSNAVADETHTSTKFQGAKANTGTVAHMVKDGKNVLTLSDDFASDSIARYQWKTSPMGGPNAQWVWGWYGVA